MTTILTALLDITLFSAIIFAAILIFQRLFRRRISAALNCAVWTLLLLRLIVPVTLDSGWHLFTVPQSVPTSALQETALSDNIETPSVASPALPVSDESVIPSQTADQTASTPNSFPQSPASSKPIDWQMIIVMAWAAGMLGFLTYTAIQWLRLSRRIKRGGMHMPESVLDMVSAEKRALRIRRNIRVSVQGWLASPALSASLRPALLLPVHSLQDKEALHFGIRHELMHFKRKDHLISLLLLALRCVYWFNPVVWVALRRIQADMETACDAAVTARMAPQERTRYIHMMIDMGRDAKPFYALGMSAGNGRKTLEKRVRGIFMTKRTGLSARIAALLLALLLFVACFTTACQPTPAAPVVVNKNEGALEAAVSATPAPAAKYEAPETWQETVQRDGSKITLDIDAQVILPNVDAYPVTRIKPGQFSQEQADRLISLLFKDATIYNAAKPLTKSELEQRLVEAKATLEQKKIDPKSNDNSEEDLQQTIDLIEQAILTAPETADDQTASTLLQPNEYGEVRLDIKADLGKKENATLWLMNHGENILNSLMCFARFVNTDSNGTFNRFDEWSLPDDAPVTLTITQDDAIAQAKQLIADLGVTGMDVAAVSRGIIGGGEGEDVSQNPQCYMVYFTRTVDGIPTIFERRGGSAMSSDPDAVKNGDYPPDFRPPWAFERILVCVDDSGVAQFQWNSPVELLGKDTENAPLLPFDQIQKIFAEQMYVNNSVVDDKLVANRTFRIEKITLGLGRVASKDDLSTYLLVPVWNFFGSTKDTYNIDAVDASFIPGDADIDEIKEYYEQRSGEYYSQPHDSFLTINAIDGSVLNLNTGY